MSKELQNIGFNLDREIREQSPKDYILGAVGAEDIEGVGDPVAGILGALYAYSQPVNGVYPRLVRTIK